MSSMDGPASPRDWSQTERLESKNSGKGWTIITALMAGLMLLSNNVTAQQQATTAPRGFACNINGIPSEKRAHYRHLVEALLHAITERRELSDGYSFRIDNEHLTTNQLVEWVNLERQCCPFFGFEILWEPENGPVWLQLTGPQGVKDFIVDEFGFR
jgi:hypothetical protein